MEAPDKIFDYRYHRSAFVLRTVEKRVRKRVTIAADQQSENHLWLCVFAVFGETAFAKIIAVVGFKVKRGYIVKYKSDLSAQNLSGVLYADLLNFILQCVMQSV